MTVLARSGGVARNVERGHQPKVNMQRSCTIPCRGHCTGSATSKFAAGRELNITVIVRSIFMKKLIAPGISLIQSTTQFGRFRSQPIRACTLVFDNEPGPGILFFVSLTWILKTGVTRRYLYTLQDATETGHLENLLNTHVGPPFSFPFATIWGGEFYNAGYRQGCSGAL